MKYQTSAENWKGVKLLEALPDIKTGIDAMNLKFDAFIDGQRTHNKRMVQILQKLADK